MAPLPTAPREEDMVFDRPRESVNPVIDVMSDSSLCRLTNLLVPYISGDTQDVSGHLPYPFFHVTLVHVRTPTLLRSAEDSSTQL